MSLTSAQHQLRWATVPQQSGPKSEGEAAVPLSVAGAGSSSNVAWAEACFRTKWYPDPFSRLATIDIGQKLKAVRLFYWGGGAGSPSNTMRPASRPTSLPRGIDPSSCLATTYTSRKRLARLLLLERSE